MLSPVEILSLGEFVKLARFFNWVLFIFNCGPHSKSPRFYNFLFPFLIGISTLFNILYVYPSYTSANPMQIIYTSAFFALHINVLGKSLTIVYNYDDFKEFLAELRKLYMCGGHPMIRERRKWNNQNLSRNISYGIITYFLAFWIGEIFLQFYFRSNGAIEFPMQYYIPFLEPDNFLFFIANLIFQNFSFIVCISIMIFVDCMMFMIACQFRSELISLAEVIAKLDDIEIYRENKGILLDIHRMHLNSLRLLNILTKIFFYMSLVQVMTSSFGLCFVFCAVLGHGLDISSLVIIFDIIAQILFYCLFGEILFAKMSTLPKVLYLTKWYEFSTNDRRNFLFILQMAQRLYIITAVGVIDVCIPTFVQVIQFSVSYCVVFYAVAYRPQWGPLGHEVRLEPPDSRNGVSLLRPAESKSTTPFGH
ncbi:hypothetical protein DMENIID0001_021710 [Sergentomyia squamirostris]